MTWRVQFHADFAPEADALSEAVRVELIAAIRLLEHLGPSLGRPAVDTLSGSKHANMKELRFRADGGVWRIAFAFDPERPPSCWLAATSQVSVRAGSTRD